LTTLPPSNTSPAGWALAEVSGRIVAADARFAALAGVATAEALTGRSWPALVALADAPLAEQAQAAIAAGRPWGGTLRLGAGARPRAVELTLSPAPPDEGRAGGEPMVVLRAMEPAVLAAPEAVYPAARVVALEAVAEHGSAQAAARAVLQELHHAVAFDWGAVLRLNGDRAEVAAVFPSAMAGIGAGSAWSPLDPAEAALASAGTPSIEGRLQPGPADRSPLGRLPGFGLASALRMPLYAGSEVAGAVLLFRGAANAFDAGDGLRAEGIARPLGRRIAEPSTATPIATELEPRAAFEPRADLAPPFAEPALAQPEAEPEPPAEAGGPPAAIEPPFALETPPPPADHEPPEAVAEIAPRAEPEPPVEAPAGEVAARPAIDLGRLEAIGEFVAGIAHELNSPLTSIAGWAQLLPELPNGARDEALSTIEREALRLGRIVQNLLYFARRQPPGRERVDLNGLLRRIAEVRGDELTAEGIELAMQLGLAPAVVGDEYQLELVLLNLISNAEEALKPDGGRITITSDADGSTARVTVTDTGPGIAPEVLPRVFEPFFTTRDVGQGAGLGLSIAYGIVGELGGELRAESPPEGGARFVVELPLPASADWTAPSAPAPDAAPREHPRVLIIDAEPAMRALLREVLADAGYDVMTAESADAALELVSEYSADLLVVDAAMAEPGGGRLLQAIDELRPELRSRALLLAGPEHEASAGELAAQGVGAVLAKPFDVDALLAAARRVLDGDAR
jgi:signal transduction histidine kinase/ActR/RegA family two-component response regulator